MNVQIGKTVEFRDSDGKVCAIYHFDDPFKSYFGVLLTPGGKNVVAPRPADHPHHKGLQFGLCASDVNAAKLSYLVAVSACKLSAEVLTFASDAFRCPPTGN